MKISEITFFGAPVDGTELNQHLAEYSLLSSLKTGIRLYPARRSLDYNKWELSYDLIFTSGSVYINVPYKITANKKLADRFLERVLIIDSSGWRKIARSIADELLCIKKSI